MDRSRDDLLAGPGLADQQDRSVHIRDLRDQLAQLAQRRALAQQARNRVRDGAALAQPAHLFGEAAVLERAVHPEDQLLDLERLGQEIVGAGANRGDRRIEAAERGDHQHRDVRVIGGHAFAELDAGDSGHPDVGHHHVEVAR